MICEASTHQQLTDDSSHCQIQHHGRGHQLQSADDDLHNYWTTMTTTWLANEHLTCLNFSKTQSELYHRELTIPYIHATGFNPSALSHLVTVHTIFLKMLIRCQKNLPKFSDITYDSINLSITALFTCRLSFRYRFFADRRIYFTYFKQVSNINHDLARIIYLYTLHTITSRSISSQHGNDKEKPTLHQIKMC